MNNGLQVTQLPLSPLVQGAVNHGIVIAGIDEEYLITNISMLVAVEEPQRARQRERIEEVVTHADHHIHVTCTH